MAVRHDGAERCGMSYDNLLTLSAVEGQYQPVYCKVGGLHAIDIGIAPLPKPSY